MAKRTDDKLDKLSLAVADRFNAEQEYQKCCETVAEALRKKRRAEARLVMCKADEAKAKLNDGALVTCSLCHAETPAATAHLHQGEWICDDDNCWDARLKASE